MQKHWREHVSQNWMLHMVSMIKVYVIYWSIFPYYCRSLPYSCTTDNMALVLTVLQINPSQFMLLSFNQSHNSTECMELPKILWFKFRVPHQHMVNGQSNTNRPIAISATECEWICFSYVWLSATSFLRYRWLRTSTYVKCYHTCIVWHR